MDPRGVDQCQGAAFVPVALAFVLLALAGAAPLRGEGTLATSPLVPPPIERVRPAADPPLVEFPSASSGTRPQRVVRVAWYDVDRLVRSNFGLIAAQLTTFFRQTDVAIVWRHGGIGVGSEDVPDDEVPVVLLATDTARLRPARPVIGTTTRKGPRVVTVLLDPIRETLGLRSLSQVLSPMEARQLAQAVARVVAHELVHALAPGQEHCARGLMQHAFSRSDLLSPLSVSDAQAVRALLAAPGRAATASSGSQIAHR